MRISDWSSDVCSSDLFRTPLRQRQRRNRHGNLLRLGGAAAAVRIAAAVPPTLRPRTPAGGRGIVDPAPHADAPDVDTDMASLQALSPGHHTYPSSTDPTTLS